MLDDIKYKQPLFYNVLSSSLKNNMLSHAYLIDINNNEFIGKSQGLQISKNMFEWISKGNSLNKVIEAIIENKENKKENGITGYLTNGFYKREIFDSSAITSALQAFLNYNQS